MQNTRWTKTGAFGIIMLFFGASVIPLIKADPIAWDVTIQCNNPGGQNDYVVFGEAPDANDGPPADSHDVAKPPAPMPSYIRTYLKDGLPAPYTNLWKDYRQYPDSAKVWNLSVKWEPEDGESPTTITMSWSTAEVGESEYTSVNLCTNAGVVLKNMLVNNTYTFTCPALVPQNFKIICSSSGNQPPVANPDTYSTNEDTTLTIAAPGVLGNDNDPDGDSITAVKMADPLHGTLLLRSNGSFIYTPNLHYFGNDSFTYRAYDGNAFSNNATVSFTINPTHYTLTITYQGSGTVTKNPDQSWYTYGQVVTLTANPSTGWVFNHWGGNLTGSTNPTSIAMNGNKNVIASFTITSGYTLTITKSGTGSGTVDANTSGPYYYGDAVTLWANASIGSTFSGWSGALTGVVTPQVLIMNGNKTVNAAFTLNGPYTLTLSTSGSGGGTIQANPSGPYYYGATVTVWANASNGSTFVGFSGGLSGTTSPQTLVMNGDKAVTANFTITSGYTLTITIQGQGTVTKVPDLPSYTYDQVVQLIANPSPGWSFSQWSGDLTGSTNPITITMTANKAVTATFSYNGGGGGGGTPPTQNQKPVADLNAGEPYQGFVDTEITFDGSKSYDPDGNITKWFWVFGDNTNGTGKTAPHIYSKAGTYTVTLTVTDNEGATNTDTITCVVKQPNRPPTEPIITGPTSGTKNTMYTYTALSTDADNDTIQYTFDWGDSLSQSSGFLPNATNYTVNHSWTAAGRYSVTVTVNDNLTESSSNITVYIDALQTRGVGYLLDNDADGIYDVFYSDEKKQTMTIQKKDDSYLIDSDGDGDWDYTYNATNGLTDYTEPPNTPGFEIIIIIGAIALVMFWKRKRR